MLGDSWRILKNMYAALEQYLEAYDGEYEYLDGTYTEKFMIDMDERAAWIENTLLHLEKQIKKEGGQV